VGFDDSQVAQVFPVGLTSVRQPLEDVAVEIVRVLGSVLSHQQVRERGVLLTPTLVVRGSSVPGLEAHDGAQRSQLRVEPRSG
jgi:LacI family transcriptional regulator